MLAFRAIVFLRRLKAWRDRVESVLNFPKVCSTDMPLLLLVLFRLLRQEGEVFRENSQEEEDEDDHGLFVRRATVDKFVGSGWLRGRVTTTSRNSWQRTCNGSDELSCGGRLQDRSLAIELVGEYLGDRGENGDDLVGEGDEELGE